MELLAHNINVGIKKVEPVIRAVLKFADVICQKLPQPTTISDMLLEGRVLSQIQLVEALTLFTLMVLQNFDKNTCSSYQIYRNYSLDLRSTGRGIHC